MNDRHPLLAAVNNILAGIIQPLVVAATIAICTASYQTYNSVQKLTDKSVAQEARITVLESRASAIEDKYMTRAELLETLKRVEQQLEIAMLRAKVPIAAGSLSGSR